MSDISRWSNSAGGNTSAAPDGAPEGMAPSAVNDTMREIMAAVRRQHEDAEWVGWGHTVSRASATTFKILTDVTAVYVADRRIKCLDTTTLYGTIASSSYTTDTTVTVTLDSGTLSASLSSVSVGILTPNTTSYPRRITKDVLTLILESTTASYSVTPRLELYHNTTLPVVGDEPGTLRFMGNNSAGSKVSYADFAGYIDDKTNGSEDGSVSIATRIAGVYDYRFWWGAGIYSHNATGGDKGIDTINVSAYYDDGVQIVANGWRYVGSSTVSGAAQLDLTSIITTGYKIHALVLDTVYVNTSSAVLNMQISTDNGSTFLTSASYGTVGTYTTAGVTTVVSSSSATNFTTAVSQSNSVNHGCNGVIYLIAAPVPSIIADLVCRGNSPARIALAGTFEGTVTVNAVRFLASSGNITGTVRVYGLRNT